MNNFILENTIWRVILNNNEEIISDNEYIDGMSDWERLKVYCLKNNLSISNMFISFRDNCIQIPKAKHYFFRRMSLSGFGKVNRIDPTYQYFIVGSTDTLNSVLLKKYLIPELTVWEEEVRLLDNEPSII